MREIFTLMWVMLIIHSTAKADTVPEYKITLNAEQVSLKQVFLDIEKQTGLFFLYNEGNLAVADKVSIRVTNARLEDVLAKLLHTRGISWKLMDKAIVLKPSSTAVSIVPPNSPPDEIPKLISVLTGAVTGVKGLPLPGATVQIKNTGKGTLTNAQGLFTLNDVPEKAVLLVRYTGYQPLEKNLDGKTYLEVKMEQQVKGLDEAVVVAYGTTTQRTNTGAVTVISGEEIQTLPNRSVDKSLQGLVPGLLVTNGTGQPGGGVSNMVLRGISTGTEVFGNSTVRNPLIVIDGMPVTQNPQLESAGTYTTPATNPLAQLNPSDIESISVLKDAAAISLYGTKAANGVILITTKRGQSGRTLLGFRSQTDLSFRPPNTVRMLDTPSYLELLYESYRNTSPNWTDAAIRADLYKKFPYRVNGIDTSFYPMPDWYDAVYEKRAMTFTNEVYLSGGNNRSTYYMNLEYTKQHGIVKESGFDRKSVRFNFDNRPADWIKIGLNTALSYTVQDLANINAGINEFALAEFISPLNPIRLDNGELIQNYSWGIPQSSATQVANPVAVQLYNTNTSIAYRGLTQLSGEVNFLKYFSFSTALGVDFMLAENKLKQDPRLKIADYGGNGSISQSDVRRANIINTNLLRFRKSIAGHHAVNVLLGQEAQVLTEKRITAAARGTDKTLPYYDEFSSPGYTVTGVSSNRSRQTLLSQFGQLGYDYRNKYFLSASARRDGASVFGDKQRWGTYWSVGAGWAITSEPFAAEKKWLNYLKIRGSIGSTGSSGAVGQLMKFSQINENTLQNMPAFTGSEVAGNPYIQREETFSWDAGLEARLFNERLQLTADVYNKSTSDLIYTMKLPTYTGHMNVNANLGDIRNRGVELAINALLLQKTPFTWRMSANWSINRNVLMRSNVPFSASFAGTLANEEGRNLGSFYMKRWAGVNPADGKPQWIDSTGKPTSNYSAAKKEFVGKPQPDGFGAATSTFGYKGIELAVQFYYQYGCQLYDDRLAQRLSDGALPYINQSAQALNRWQKPGDVALNPQRKLGNTDRGNSTSTRYLLQGDYIRLQYIKLSYAIPKKVLQPIKLSSIQLFLQGNNLAVWTGFAGWDPDNANVGGGLSSPYPVSRSYSAGLNVQL